VHLAELNWEAFYQQRLAARASAAANGDAKPSGLIVPPQ
jgi:hypothetical protein